MHFFIGSHLKNLVIPWTYRVFQATHTWLIVIGILSVIFDIFYRYWYSEYYINISRDIDISILIRKHIQYKSNGISFSSVPGFLLFELFRYSIIILKYRYVISNIIDDMPINSGCWHDKRRNCSYIILHVCNAKDLVFYCLKKVLFTK